MKTMYQEFTKGVTIFYQINLKKCVWFAEHKPPDNAFNCVAVFKIRKFKIINQ